MNIATAHPLLKFLNGGKEGDDQTFFTIYIRVAGLQP